MSTKDAPGNPLRIREVRKARGMQQQELAARVGVTNTTLSCWERGKFLPDIKWLPILAKALGCTIECLYADAPMLEPLGADVEEALCTRMARWRRQNELSKKEAAIECGCTDPAWIAWEAGEAPSKPWREQIEFVLSAPPHKKEARPDDSPEQGRGTKTQ